MRPKVLLSALVLAVAILAPALYFHFKPDSPAPDTDNAVAAAPDNSAPPAQALPSILKRVQGAPSVVGGGLPDRPVAPAAMSHDDYVTQRTGELIEMGLSEDPQNLKVILSEMENPDAEIRHAALNATIDFGSKDAIPYLQNELAYATDLDEKVEIKKAIDFLQLPRFGDDSSPVAQQ
jgi:hypothetical protein